MPQEITMTTITATSTTNVTGAANAANATNADHLDQTYTALAEATARVGEARAPLFLATLSLALLSRQADAGEALALIAQAERLAGT
jgi:hypothetical protein